LRLGTSYKLAVVLTKSQLRGYQRSRIIARIFGNPRIILVADAALIAVPALLGYFLISQYMPAQTLRSFHQIEIQGLAGIPATIAFIMILFGVLAEISQSVQSMSTDLVNWLPISPAEYVLGSTMSLSYTYSFFLSLLLGASLGPALLLGMAPVWVVTALVSILSLFVGACIVELLRALTNRLSSSFYKKSGRSGIFFRLALTIVVLAFVQLLFSGQIIVYLLQSLTQTVQAAWFIPVVWPSLAVLGASQGNIVNLTSFMVLTSGFLVGLFLVTAWVRATYWVPVPVTIRLTNQAYRPLTRNRTFPGLGVAEFAIFRKDVRSLTRRREMARFLAIPFVFAISLGISLFPIAGASAREGPGFLALIPVYLMPVAIFCAIISMTSLGQEGNAVWNLYVAPMNARQILKAKLLIVGLLGFAFSLGMLIFLALLLRIGAVEFLSLLVIGIAVVLSESAIGLYFAAKFPDFRETVRSRYVTVWGSLLGTFLSLLIAMITATPVLVSLILQQTITYPMTILSIMIGLVIFAGAWRLAERQTRTLLQEIRI
jgi:hypothetical protein